MSTVATPKLKSDVRSAFKSVGAEVTDALSTRIAALSTQLRLSPNQLAEAWEAHSVTKNVSVLDDVSFAAYRSSLAGLAGDNNNRVVGTSFAKRKASPSSVTPTPNKSKVKREQLATPSSSSSTPTTAGSKNILITPTKTPTYQERTSRGEVVSSYNPHGLPTAAASRLSSDDDGHIAASIQYHPSSSHPTKSYRHMFTPLEARAQVLEERLTMMSDKFQEAHSESDEVAVKQENALYADAADSSIWAPVGIPKQNTVRCVGRICNEAHEGRLNRASLRLEGSRQHSAGSRIHLDLQALSDSGSQSEDKRDYSLFPGQIVAVEGINSSGRTILASRLIEGVPPPSEKHQARELLDYHHGSERQDGKPLSIVTLCGPFTTKDNLNYDPLQDIVYSISRDKPDVVIMCGPFVDARQPLVKGGEPTISDENGNERKATYEELFSHNVSQLLEEMYQNDPTMKTQFVLVPSVEDAFVDSVYPQPPFVKERQHEFADLGLDFVESAGRENEKNRRNRVHCVSNPCTLKINELTIGVTSSDVLFHISSDECNANLPPGTRMTRIAQHLIQQRSYYPLFPAVKGASLDLAKANQWEMPCQPDILIVPSKLASFAKPVLERTIVVNPGELTKNTTGGTYATIDVHPMKRDTLEDAAEADMEMYSGIQDRVRVDIKRI
ncbi:hypothetical protein ACHAWC_004999 [Mediolabrus comicus]